jgi:hypothetical protein
MITNPNYKGEHLATAVQHCLVCQAPIEEGERTADIHYRGEKMGTACAGCKNEGGI